MSMGTSPVCTQALGCSGLGNSFVAAASLHNLYPPSAGAPWETFFIASQVLEKAACQRPRTPRGSAQGLLHLDSHTIFIAQSRVVRGESLAG